MKIRATLLISAAFLTLAAPALADDSVKADTGSAAGLTDHSAVLRGQLSASGVSLSVYFQYGPSVAYGSQTTPTPYLLSGTLAVKANVVSLAPSTEYHYRIVSGGLFGTVYGKDVTFTTNATGSGGLSGNVGGDNAGVTTTSADDTSSATGDASAQPDGPGSPSPEPGDSQPELGQKVVAGAASGTVGVKSPGASAWATLAGNAPVPVGSIVDARRGTVQLVTALPGGATQTGTFHGSMFEVRQAPGGHGVTDLVLRGGSFAACGSSTAKAGAAHAAGHRSRVVRQLWGSDHHGRFRTRGSNSIATVRGTQWVTTDRCDGTLTSVSQGSVSVRDLHAKRTVLVRAGHSYLARGRR